MSFTVYKDVFYKNFKDLFSFDPVRVYHDEKSGLAIGFCGLIIDGVMSVSVCYRVDNPTDFEDLSNGFTPRLHLLKVSYPMNDESTLRDAGCFFYG